MSVLGKGGMRMARGRRAARPMAFWVDSMRAARIRSGCLFTRSEVAHV